MRARTRFCADHGVKRDPLWAIMPVRIAGNVLIGSVYFFDTASSRSQTGSPRKEDPSVHDVCSNLSTEQSEQNRDHHHNDGGLNHPINEPCKGFFLNLSVHRTMFVIVCHYLCPAVAFFQSALKALYTFITVVSPLTQCVSVLGLKCFGLINPSTIRAFSPVNQAGQIKMIQMRNRFDQGKAIFTLSNRSLEKR